MPLIQKNQKLYASTQTATADEWEALAEAVTLVDEHGVPTSGGGGGGAGDASAANQVIANDKLERIAVQSESTAPVSIYHDSGAVTVNGVAVVPKWAHPGTAASGDNLVVAAVTAKKIRVLAYKVRSSGTVNWKFRSGSTDIGALAYEVANSGEVGNFNPMGWFETAAGAALNINLSAAVPVGCHVCYIEV